MGQPRKYLIIRHTCLKCGIEMLDEAEKVLKLSGKQAYGKSIKQRWKVETYCSDCKEKQPLLELFVTTFTVDELRKELRLNL